MKTSILGASPNPDRYSHKAMKLLAQNGHETILVSPNYEEIQGQKVISSLSEIQPESIHTLTMYVNPSVSSQLEKEILELKPNRVIFNPGSENPALNQKLQKAGIETEEACTLVLLQTGQF